MEGDDEMRIRRSFFSIAWASLLSGCMMTGGAWHGDRAPAIGHMASLGSSQVSEVTRMVEANNGRLTIELSFATPGSGEELPIDATLSEDGVTRKPTHGDVRLNIRTPGGSVDQLRMEPLGLSQGATHQTRYRFADAGLYQLTAEGRMGSGVDARTVSVTTETEVGGRMRGHEDGWLVPAAVLGGLGMVGIMLLMMGGSAH
jgi:hypothetical protein